MRQAGRALRLTIFLDEDLIWHHKPVYHEIVHRARRAGLAGATVLRGCEGYGAGSVVHTTRLLSVAENLPSVIIVVDSEERIRSFLPELDELLEEGTVILDEVETIRYVSRKHGG